MNVCEKFHRLAFRLERYSAPFDIEALPVDGIYILFEHGESSHSGERIVRVGTHNGDRRLGKRLKEHFVNENKDRSIFRKNIGRALLNLRKDPILAYWDLDLLTKKSRETHFDPRNHDRQMEVERAVTNCIVKNFSFSVLPMTEKQKRLSMESKVISMLNYCAECKPSEKWLGLHSPVQKIKESGLWLVHHLNDIPLTCSELESLT
jgi:hypothetical protein